MTTPEMGSVATARIGIVKSLALLAAWALTLASPTGIRSATWSTACALPS